MDERLRGWERRALAGDPEAAGQLLRELVRLGRLAPERLELAAQLGFPPALRALARADATPGELRAWVWALRPWGRDVVVRALLAAARAGGGGARDPRAELLFAVTEAWCDCPCPRHAEEAYRASLAASANTHGAYQVARAAHVAGHRQGSPERDALETMVGITLREILVRGQEEPVRAGIRRELLAWALPPEARALAV